jgi:hypothetical protein
MEVHLEVLLKLIFCTQPPNFGVEAHIEVLLKLIFCTQPPNFGVEAHIEAPTGVALMRL